MAATRDELLSALQALAPLELSEPWDNVGLLVDPEDRTSFARAFVTIDLTQTTLDEVDELGADFIVSYHPPIFSGLKRLRASAPGESVVVRALRAGLPIYSPHTALDAVEGGMNDWLARAVGAGKTQPIVAHESSPRAGGGRLVQLTEGVTIEHAIERVKAHLGIDHVRVARASGDPEIRSVAVCPGAGGSLFEKVGAVDLLITGEMRHHDILSRRAMGTHVIVTDHTNTERGFLPTFAQQLAERCPGIDVQVSQTDSDPLAVA